MNEHELEKLVAAAVRAVLAQLAEAPPPAPGGRVVRVLIGDTQDGLDFALASLNSLATELCRLEYVVTSGERAQVAPAHLRQAGAAAEVRTPADVGCPREHARGADVVVAAALDRPTALRVGLTLGETWAARFLLEALCRGTPTVVATDGLELEAPDATAQLRQALLEPVGRLEVFGATCVAAVDLASAVRQALAGPTSYSVADSRPLITAAEVEAADGDLTVPPGAIITPMALDRARELGVKLHRVPH